MSATHAVVLEKSTYAGEQNPRAFETLAHDLRQPLSTIDAIAYYLEMTLPPELTSGPTCSLTLRDYSKVVAGYKQ